MPENFSNKKLRGRDFTGRDLTEANFKGSDIRGAKFTNAVLIRVDFSEVKAGLEGRWSLTRIGILFVMSATAISLSMSFCSTIIDYLLSSGTGGWSGIWWTILVLLFYTSFFLIIVNCGFTVRAFRNVLNTAIFIYITMFLTTCSRSFSSVDFSPILITVLGVLVNAVVTASFVVVIGLNQLVLIIVSFVEIVGLTLSLFYLLANSSPPITIGGIQLTITILFSIFLILSSSCIAWYALKGDQRFEVVRTFSIIAASVGGTSFQGADLTEANFYKAWLRNTDFDGANLALAYWYQSRRIDLIIHGETYLKSAAIRKLVSTLEGKGRNFDRNNLKGINLEGADLSNASFIATDLSGANLRKANLSNAKLVGTKLDFANLEGACITGSYIKDIGITRKTNLEKIDCKYVFMDLPTEDNPDPQRMPPSQQGDFEGNDFQVFITSVLETLDLYHKQEINAGIAINILKGMTEKYPVTFELVGLENRGNRQFVIRLKVNGLTSHFRLQEEYYSRYEQKLPVNDPQRLIPDTETIIAKMIEDMKQNPGTQILSNQGIVITGGVVSMSNEQNITTGSGSFINTGSMHVVGSTLNLGEISGNVANKISQLPEVSGTEQPNLKALLTQLQQVIEADVDLSIEDKADLLEQVESLVKAEQAEQPAKKEGLIRKANKIFEATLKGLPATAQIVEACSKLLPMILKALGFST